jgi:hypothetical protein
MYAFTAIDLDFGPEVSCNPLGFQPVWAETGRRLIKYLSTVSGNINVVKILCIVRYFFEHNKKLPDESLLKLNSVLITRDFIHMDASHENVLATLENLVFMDDELEEKYDKEDYYCSIRFAKHRL